MAKRISDIEVQNLVAHYIGVGENYDKSELSAKRTRAMEYYNGEMNDTPSQKGRSSVVSHDVADTIGWILPGVMRVFTASDEIVEFEPKQEEDEQFARQEADYINHIFWKEHDGYNIIWDSAHDAMLCQNGIIKHYWDKTPDEKTSTHSNLSEMQLAKLLEDGAEVLTSDVKETKLGPVYDVKIKRTDKTGKLCIEVVAPEDFLIDGQAESVDETRFCAHKQEKTRSDLVKMGFDKSTVMTIPSLSNNSETEEEARLDGVLDTNENGVDRSTELVDLFECYIEADADGDGIAETLRVLAAGKGANSKVLDWEVWDDDLPFTDIVIDRVPHRLEGRSISDETMDIQQVKTVLLRQHNDNLYAVNNPQPEVEAGSVLNMDSLTSPKFGQPIQRKKGSIAPINWKVVPYIGDKVFAGLNYQDEVLEKRTGVSRATMALDPGALQNQTAEGVRESKDSAHSKIELIARNLANGYERMFAKILRLVVKHQDRPRKIKLRGENNFVEVDPSHWNAEMDVTVNTGLGTGSRDRDMSMLNSVLQNQYLVASKMVEFGLPSAALKMLPLIRNTLAKLCESAGLKNPDLYYPELGEEEIAALEQEIAQQQQQPDPKAQEMQAKLQMEQAKMQMQAQQDQAKSQMATQEMQAKLEIERQKMGADIMLKREQLAAEMELKREQLVAELQLKREQAMMGAAVGSDISNVHMGGEPG